MQVTEITHGYSYSDCMELIKIQKPQSILCSYLPAAVVDRNAENIKLLFIVDFYIIDIVIKGYYYI